MQTTIHYYNEAFPFSTVVITGGTGSFGQAMTRYLLDTCPDVKIRIFSRGELKQITMERQVNDARVSYLLGDIRSLPRLRLAFSGADLVIHAAALKHVRSGESNPDEVIDVNINGTRNVVYAAIESNVRSVIFLSSDKAVEPINLYGATKMTSERLIVQANTYSPEKTMFSVARYGNVINSNGSVLEVFQRSRKPGVMLPVTDIRMTRFWMTLNKAASFIYSIARFSVRGAIFVPYIPAFYVMDLCRAMLHESNIVENVHFEITGKGQGEKIHESLMTKDETERSFHSVPEGFFCIPAPISTWEKDPTYEDWDSMKAVQDTLYSFPPYNSESWHCRMGEQSIRKELETI